VIKLKRIVLVTSSKRRIDLLRNLGIDPIIVPPKNIFERQIGSPERIVIENARSKIRSVLGNKDIPRDAILIAADTIIVDSGNRIYGKPNSVDHAAKMLKKLRGKWHRVITGVVVFDLMDHSIDEFTVVTHVKMRNFSDEELKLYLASLEGLDKAGAYALQGLGSLLIEEIRGDPYNVIGLPLSRLHEVLLKHDVNLLGLGVLKRIVGVH